MSRTKYNKIVNYDSENGEVTVLNETFTHSDDFKGATGSIFQIISKADFYETIEPYLDNDIELLIYMAENFGNLNREMIERVDSSEDALKELFFDISYSEDWDAIREELSLNEDEAYIFNCVGGGRCFDKDFQGNIRPELSEVIREFEN